MTQPKNALLSVFDKAGIDDFARALFELGWNLYSSGGTAKKIAEAGLPVTDVADLTGFPAILGHRVVTLHPKVHGGILGRPDLTEDQADMQAYEIVPFGLVVVNLYPFADTVASDASFEECIEKIDVGGPTMVRAAAKNHKYVGVVTDPGQYDRVLTELQDGELSAATRKSLAIEAFAHTATYDLAVVEWLSDGDYRGTLGKKVQDCDYGENRWQSPAGLYKQVGATDSLAVSNFQVVAGRNPSYINWTDVERLLQTVTHAVAEYEVNVDGDAYVAVAVKHGNPCGAAIGHSPEEAIRLMLEGDTRAVFGAVVMTNFPITGEIAELLLYHATDVRRLLDGVCAPSFDEGALSNLGRRDGKYFLAVNPALAKLGVDSLDQATLVRPVRGGFLVQPNYTNVVDLKDATITGGELTEQQRIDLALGLAVCATSNSNTVTLVRDGQLIGNGVGQQDRVGCCELAVLKTDQNGHDMNGAVAVSDSFFPFSDGPQILIDAGVKTIFSTTGSTRDGDTQTLCEERGVTLVQLSDADARMFYRH